MGMCGNDKVRRSAGFRRRNQIREENPSRTLCKCCRMWLLRSRCKTIPFEKGTETSCSGLCICPGHARCKTIPFEKGTETLTKQIIVEQFLAMQDHPLREGD